MSGMKGFGIGRLPPTLGNIGITATILPAAGTQQISGLDGTNSFDFVADPVYLLGTGSIAYGRITGTDTILPLTVSNDFNGLALNDAVALSTLSQMVARRTNSDLWAPVVSLDSNNFPLGEVKGAILTTRAADFAVTASGVENAPSAEAPITADVSWVATSIDATLIVPPTVNQPFLTVELVQRDITPTETVLWSRQMGMGVAAGDQGYTQSISISGLNILADPDHALELRFSAATEAGVGASVSLTYNALVID